MAKHIDRLEQALKMWEDLTFATSQLTLAVIELKGVRTNPRGVIKHWRDFRKYLLSFRGENFDLYKFTIGEDTDTSFRGIPASFAAWSAFSRAVYHLTPQLQAMLELTPVNNLRWQDVPWPYTAFCILFDRPVYNLENVPCDVIMVSRRIYFKVKPEIRDNDLELRLLPRTLADVPRLTRAQIRQWDRLRESGRWEQLKQETRQFLRSFRNKEVEDLQVFQIPAYDLEFITDSLDELTFSQPNPKAPIAGPDASTNKTAAHALRIAVGLSLYLSSLPAKDASVVYQGQPPTGELVYPITRGADVCRVLSNFTLTDEEVESIGGELAIRPFHEVAPHWRRGHFRRPWGQAKNPRARKTVWIRPVLVQRNRLAPNAQVGGAQIDVE